MGVEHEIPKPGKFAIFGIILNILFYPTVAVWLVYGTTLPIGPIPLLLLLLFPYSLPLIGSYCMKKAINIAKINNSKTGLYYLLMVTSLVHEVILLFLLYSFITGLGGAID